MQPGGNRQKGLAGAGLADQGNQLDAVVQKQVQGEGLLAVAGMNAPDPFLGDLLDRQDLAAARIVPADGGVGTVQPVPQA